MRGGRQQHDRPDVSIITSGHDVADARLHRHADALMGAGLAVEVLGLGDAATGPANAFVRAWPPAGRVRRLGRAVLLPWKARGRVLMTLDPDVAITARVRRYGGRRLVADVHEDYDALLRDRAWARSVRATVARTIASVATAAAARADLTVVADDHVPPHGARRRIVVRNIPDRDHLPVTVGRSDDPRAVYVGSLSRSRGLFDMLAAIEQAPGWTLDLVGHVAPEDEGAVARWRRRSPATARVRFFGRRPPQQSWSIAAGAWAGLCMLHDTPAYRDAVPSKVYEYLACGIPVVSTPLPRVVGLLEQSGGGVVTADTDALAQLLVRWTDNPDELDTYASAGRTWAAEHLDGSPHDELAERVDRLLHRVEERTD